MFNAKKSILSIACAITLSACDNPSKPTIGIIEPMEHTAMNEIVNGFTQTLRQTNPDVVVKVENAQGDANLERALIQKMRDAHYDMIVPIGVSATQMSLAMTHNQAVVSLASDLTDRERKQQTCHATAVHDEISTDKILSFIHKTYPSLTHLTLVHSATDKVFPQVKETVATGKRYGITIDTRMVATLPELYTIAQNIPKDSQGIFVLKDSPIVSGIATLAKTAAARHIPLITSDQGSVQDGAGFALGVHERDIGVAGAKLASAVLNGQSICQLPIADMTALTVFVNPVALKQTGQTTETIKAAAQSLQYKVESVTS